VESLLLAPGAGQKCPRRNRYFDSIILDTPSSAEQNSVTVADRSSSPALAQTLAPDVPVLQNRRS
jgi:hypothetical protein